MKKPSQSVHEGNKPFKCDICEIKFAQKRHLSIHFASLHKRKSLSIFGALEISTGQGKSDAKESSISNIENHDNPSSSKEDHLNTFSSQCKETNMTRLKSNKCSFCATNFPTLKELTNHIDSVHEERLREMNCQTSDAAFVNKLPLVKHNSLVHEGTKPKTASNNSKISKCSFCGMFFPTFKKMMRHNDLVHDGKKQFNCKICDASFVENKRLIRHIASVHEGKKPFKCNICDAKYFDKRYLTEHIAIIHAGVKPFKCDICNASFTSRES